jgi:tRNA modification GTPase
MAAESLTTVVVLTPPGRGAIATIQVTGADSLHLVSKHFQPAGRRALDRRGLGQLLFGRWDAPEGDEVVVCRRDPKCVEIHCHGGRMAPQAIVESLLADGCRPMEWDQWIAEYEVDRTRSAARIALASAGTLRAATILADQFGGALRRAIDALRHDLAEGRIREAQARVDRLLAAGRVGAHLLEPWRVVLAGWPNVGKSSLINALLGYRRVIVYDQPGTTRDVVTAGAAFDGWPVELADTAGLCASDDPLEAAGVARAREQLARADLVVLVFAADQPWRSDDETLLAEWPQALVVHSKCDVAAANTGRGRPPGARTSAVTGEGIAALERELVTRLVPAAPSSGQAVPFQPDQIASLHDVRELLGRGEYAVAGSRLLSGPWMLRANGAAP